MTELQLTDPSVTVTASKNSVACDLEGEKVILHLDSGTYFGLNAVGADIWDFVQASHSLREIQSHLMSQYNVDPVQCEAEVLAIVQKMASHGLIDIHAV